ncbi:hypothetical protein KIL84_000227 [Mauremys mutica]|uniref:Uncharacterized protein n=1 Tax=Mauremys mutica TaxID=74926 RepID=A0A9D3XFY1_9SAUR|nr:hypothetical protein KIL84_000227 [Mauremys mutica]
MADMTGVFPPHWKWPRLRTANGASPCAYETPLAPAVPSGQPERAGVGKCPRVKAISIVPLPWEGAVLLKEQCSGEMQSPRPGPQARSTGGGFRSTVLAKSHLSKPAADAPCTKITLLQLIF